MNEDGVPSVNPKLDAMCELLKTIHDLQKKNKELEAQVEKMKCCEICEYGGNVLRYCYSEKLCNNRDKWKLSHRLSERKEYRKDE